MNEHACKGEEEVLLPPVQAVTGPGDLWLIGTYWLVCGDDLDHGRVMRLFDRGCELVVAQTRVLSKR